MDKIIEKRLRITINKLELLFKNNTKHIEGFIKTNLVEFEKFIDIDNQSRFYIRFHKDKILIEEICIYANTLVVEINRTGKDGKHENMITIKDDKIIKCDDLIGLDIDHTFIIELCQKIDRMIFETGLFDLNNMFYLFMNNKKSTTAFDYIEYLSLKKYSDLMLKSERKEIEMKKENLKEIKPVFDQLKNIFSINNKLGIYGFETLKKYIDTERFRISFGINFIKYGNLKFNIMREDSSNIFVITYNNKEKLKLKEHNIEEYEQKLNHDYIIMIEYLYVLLTKLYEKYEESMRNEMKYEMSKFQNDIEKFVNEYISKK